MINNNTQMQKVKQLMEKPQNILSLTLKEVEEVQQILDINKVKNKEAENFCFFLMLQTEILKSKQEVNELRSSVE